MEYNFTVTLTFHSIDRSCSTMICTAWRHAHPRIAIAALFEYAHACIYMDIYTLFRTMCLYIYLLSYCTPYVYIYIYIGTFPTFPIN